MAPCGECHHRPSERTANIQSHPLDGEPVYAECYCECHNAANHALELLAALRRYVYAYQPYMDGQEDANEIASAEREARAVLEKIERKSRNKDEVQK